MTSVTEWCHYSDSSHTNQLNTIGTTCHVPSSDWQNLFPGSQTITTMSTSTILMMETLKMMMILTCLVPHCHHDHLDLAMETMIKELLLQYKFRRSEKETREKETTSHNYKSLCL